ncbi:MAG: LruC domain-containing protein [SAR324 cluster bacterium]|nr:LruC domain-containing protein [SAR324 cluster bacterium]
MNKFNLIKGVFCLTFGLLIFEINGMASGQGRIISYSQQENENVAIKMNTLATESIRLTDVIRSQDGYGAVDLLKDMKSSDLEVFRLQGNGGLMIAVDVNENASGTEKSTSQGIAIKTLKLTIIMDGITHEWTQFSTATSATLMASNETTRSNYYTVLGDSGSNRITTNSIQAKFDSIITISVEMALTGTITSALLDIQLLETKTSLGDPEAFYDFTGGFEDLALLNFSDAVYISNLEAGRQEAPSVEITSSGTTDSSSGQASVPVNWFYYPADTNYYFVGYEDQYPSNGDYDFNDLVVAYNVQVGVNSNNEVIQIVGVAYILARGATFNHEWHLRIQVPGASGQGTITTMYPAAINQPSVTNNVQFSSEIDLKLFPDTRFLFTAQTSVYINTLLEEAFVSSPKATFQIDFTQPISLNQMETAPFDPYLYVRNTLKDIHLPGKSAIAQSQNMESTFKNDQGFPFAMMIPGNWNFPLEKVDLGIAYPKFSNYVKTKGGSDSDWYNFPASGKVRNYSEKDWKW